MLENMFKTVCEYFSEQNPGRKNMFNYEWVIVKLASYIGIDLSPFANPVRSRVTLAKYKRQWEQMETVLVKLWGEQK
jgi:hypothetical protein